MSMSLSGPTTPVRPAVQESARLRWSLGLARYTARRRQELGLTVEQAAALSGLQLSEWYGLEEGWVPEELATLRALAGALRVRWTDYHMLAFLAECGRKCR